MYKVFDRSCGGGADEVNVGGGSRVVRKYFRVFPKFFSQQVMLRITFIFWRKC